MRCKSREHAACFTFKRRARNQAIRMTAGLAPEARTQILVKSLLPSMLGRRSSSWMPRSALIRRVPHRGLRSAAEHEPHCGRFVSGRFIAIVPADGSATGWDASNTFSLILDAGQPASVLFFLLGSDQRGACGYPWPPRHYAPSFMGDLCRPFH